MKIERDKTDPILIQIRSYIFELLMIPTVYFWSLWVKRFGDRSTQWFKKVLGDEYVL